MKKGFMEFRQLSDTLHDQHSCSLLDCENQALQLVFETFFDEFSTNDQVDEIIDFREEIGHEIVKSLSVRIDIDEVPEDMDWLSFDVGDYMEYDWMDVVFKEVDFPKVDLGLNIDMSNGTYAVHPDQIPLSKLSGGI